MPASAHSASIEQARQCRRCGLADSRERVVLPDGPAGGLLAVGEAPGRNEEAAGVGFCGAAGHNLDRLLDGLGLPREAWARTNTVWCRPPDNRRPRRSESAACRVNLDSALREWRPRVLLAVGETAARALVPDIKPAGGSYLDVVEKLVTSAEAREARWPRYRGIPVIPMPHTSPLAWNRRRPDGTPIRELGARAAAEAVRLLRT